jgi:TRAP-type C4-dicarboxylate transport system substrate-binding protein
MNRHQHKRFRVAASALAIFCGTAVNAQDEFPSMNLKFAMPLAETVVQSQNVKQWAEDITEASGGNIKIQIFWSGSLGAANEMLDLISSGAVELGSLSPAYFPSQMPLTGVTQLPNVYPDPATVSAVAHAIGDTKALQAENAKNNLVPLFWTTLPNYHIYCDTEIETVADFTGTKQRAYGEYVPRMWEAVGAVGVVTTSTEQYEGLQRGLMDCIYGPADFALSYHFNEVADYYIDLNFGAITQLPVYVNAAVWDSWPETVKELFRDASAKAIERDITDVPAKAEEALATMMSGGLRKVAFKEEDAFRAAVPNFLDLWVEELSKRGLGAEAEEVRATIDAELSR